MRCACLNILDNKYSSHPCHHMAAVMSLLFTPCCHMAAVTWHCHVTAVYSLLSHGCCHVALSCHCCLLPAITWLLSHGCCHVTAVYSLPSHGCCHMAAVTWLLSQGCCHMAAVTWLLSQGCCYVTAITWLLVYCTACAVPFPSCLPAVVSFNHCSLIPASFTRKVICDWWQETVVFRVYIRLPQQRTVRHGGRALGRAGWPGLDLGCSRSP